MLGNQAYLFLVFSLVGALIGLLFDFFRILRKNFKTKDFITYIQDFLFWTLTGLIILYAIFYFNDGEIRLFMFLGIIMGILLYMLILSNLIIKTSSFIINIVKNVINLITKILIYPLKIVFSTLKKIFKQPAMFIYKKIQQYTSKIINSTKKCKKQVEISK